MIRGVTGRKNAIADKYAVKLNLMDVYRVGPAACNEQVVAVRGKDYTVGTVQRGKRRNAVNRKLQWTCSERAIRRPEGNSCHIDGSKTWRTGGRGIEEIR